MAASKDFDVIAIGRSSIDLYGTEIGVDLSEAALFRSSVGGSPTNIAIGAARLGLRSAMLTRVGADQTGTTILRTLADEGVDTSAIKKDAERLTALVLLAVQDRTNSPHIFYRQDCADMALSEADIDPAYIARTKSIVVTGTHFSTDRVAAASWKAIDLAKEHGAKIVFDIDFRPSLWGLAAHADGADRAALAPRVAKAFSAVIEAADLVVGTEEEICAASGVADVAQALTRIRSSSKATIVCKRGAYGCDVYGGGHTGDLEAPVQGARFSVKVMNTIGAGDAFMAGFLRGYLTDEPLEVCATLANASGAVAVTRLLCSEDYAYWPELQDFIRGAGVTGSALKDDPQVKRRDGWDEFFILACDHRSQFRDIAEKLGTDDSRFPLFKRLAVQAVEQVRNSQPNVGIILDEEYGADALFDAGRHDITCARPVERPGSRPIEFVTGRDIGTKLMTWPRKQIVKCLCHYDPEDEPGLLHTQQERLQQVHEACVGTGHKLLLEIIPPKTQSDRGQAVLAAMRQIYALGVKPDFWKLEPFSDASAWASLSAVIQENDPDCEGVLILGQTSSKEEVANAFQAAARTPIVCGFAIGRGIVGEAFEGWLSGTLDDQGAVAMMTENFSHFIRVWKSFRTQAEAKPEV